MGRVPFPQVPRVIFAFLLYYLRAWNRPEEGRTFETSAFEFRNPVVVRACSVKVYAPLDSLALCSL